MVRTLRLCTDYVPYRDESNDFSFCMNRIWKPTNYTCFWSPWLSSLTSFLISFSLLWANKKELKLQDYSYWIFINKKFKQCQCKIWSSFKLFFKRLKLKIGSFSRWRLNWIGFFCEVDVFKEEAESLKPVVVFDHDEYPCCEQTSNDELRLLGKHL